MLYRQRTFDGEWTSSNNSAVRNEKFCLWQYHIELVASLQYQVRCECIRQIGQMLTRRKAVSTVFEGEELVVPELKGELVSRHFYLP